MGYSTPAVALVPSIHRRLPSPCADRYTVRLPCSPRGRAMLGRLALPPVEAPLLLPDDRLDRRVNQREQRIVGNFRALERVP